MPHYKHTFRCIQCSGLVVYKDKTVDADGVPMLRHGELDSYTNDLERGTNKKTTVSKCLGRLMYESTQTVEIPVRNSGPVDVEWQDLVLRVQTAWRAFKQARFDPSLRGPNHDRAYKPPLAVTKRLQNAGGSVVIGNTMYTISPSNTSNVSLHRQLTQAQGAEGTYQSFVFHL